MWPHCPLGGAWGVFPKHCFSFPMDGAGTLKTDLSFYSYSNPHVAIYLQGWWFGWFLQEPAAVRLAAVCSVHCGTYRKREKEAGGQ